MKMKTIWLGKECERRRIPEFRQLAGSCYQCIPHVRLHAHFRRTQSTRAGTLALGRVLPTAAADNCLQRWIVDNPRRDQAHLCRLLDRVSEGASWYAYRVWDLRTMMFGWQGQGIRWSMPGSHNWRYCRV